MADPTPVEFGGEIGTPLIKFTLRQRFLLWLISSTITLIIRILGPTLKIAVSFEDGGPPSFATRPMVASFWHNCMIPAIYYTRDLGIRVMSSDSFDGEWTGRIIRKFGFVKVRGSTSRGAIRAVIGMKREIEKGWTVAFTIDGPRGPRYVAKPGPVMLARATGAPMVAFYAAAEKSWTLKTWDGAVIPKPFSKVLFRMSERMMLDPDADREAGLAQLQTALERTRIFAEENVSKVGSPEFPLIPRERPTG